MRENCDDIEKMLGGKTRVCGALEGSHEGQEVTLDNCACTDPMCNGQEPPLIQQLAAGQRKGAKEAKEIFRVGSNNYSAATTFYQTIFKFVGSAVVLLLFI